MVTRARVRACARYLQPFCVRTTSATATAAGEAAAGLHTSQCVQPSAVSDPAGRAVPHGPTVAHHAGAGRPAPPRWSMSVQPV